MFCRGQASAMFSFMLFIFLGFLAIIIVCLYFIYSQEKLCHILRDEHAEMRLLLRSMESRLAAFERGNCAKAQTGDDTDELLSLDFHDPDVSAKPRVNPDLDLHFDPQEAVAERQESQTS